MPAIYLSWEAKSENSFDMLLNIMERDSFGSGELSSAPEDLVDDLLVRDVNRRMRDTDWAWIDSIEDELHESTTLETWESPLMPIDLKDSSCPVSVELDHAKFSNWSQFVDSSIQIEDSVEYYVIKELTNRNILQFMFVLNDLGILTVY